VSIFGKEIIVFLMSALSMALTGCAYSEEPTKNLENFKIK
jgi:hypothetical protein